MSRRRLRIEHRTGYRYESTVAASFNEVRMTPLNTRQQHLISHQLHINPGAGVTEYADYWGTTVHSFDVHDPHLMLEVISTSTVDTASEHIASPGCSWADLESLSLQDRYCEFLTGTKLVELIRADDSRMEVVETMRAQESPIEAITVAFAAVRERITYRSGATNVFTTASQAWELGLGVCQDYSHALLALLRTARIPARYVSGYLHDPASTAGVTSIGESHAWVEFWNGGWEAVDPTNSREVAGSHVLVARGRDYEDIAPLKGIYAGGKSEALGVAVQITELPR
jgi:transglutaminase-like putative cysteine protease